MTALEIAATALLVPAGAFAMVLYAEAFSTAEELRGRQPEAHRRWRTRSGIWGAAAVALLLTLGGIIA